MTQHFLLYFVADERTKNYHSFFSFICNMIALKKCSFANEKRTILGVQNNLINQSKKRVFLQNVL